ncbi:MAG: efflux RND transporter periplasmic adaptor subunit, partial [Myxococcota bacterium]
MKKPLLALALLAACGGKEEETPTSTERPAKRVRVESVEAASLKDVLVLPATVEAREATTLATGRPGRIDGITADTGDRVRKGQAIVRINAASAYAELKQAKAAYDSNKSAFERTEKLLSRKLSTDAAVEVARANLAQTEAALELARANVEYAVLRAPHSGLVSARNVSVGEYASPGTALLDIVDIDQVKVVVKVPERDIDAIQLGTSAEFFVD